MAGSLEGQAARCQELPGTFIRGTYDEPGQINRSRSVGSLALNIRINLLPASLFGDRQLT